MNQKPQKRKRRGVARTKETAKTGNHLKPHFAAFFGKTGSGKGYAMWQKYLEWQAEEKQQTLVWSPKEFDSRGVPLDDYAGRLHCKAYTGKGKFVQFVRDVRAGRNAVYVPSGAREDEENVFDLFNRLALAVSPCTMIVDEAHTATRANGGQPAWQYNTTTGRASGLRILAASTRPTHFDKDFFGALSYAWCGCQLFEDDAKTVAKLVLCKPNEIMEQKEFEAKTRAM